MIILLINQFVKTLRDNVFSVALVRTIIEEKWYAAAKS